MSEMEKENSDPVTSSSNSCVRGMKNMFDCTKALRSVGNVRHPARDDLMTQPHYFAGSIT